MINRSGVIKFALCGILIFGTGLIVLNFISYNRHQSDHTLTKKNNDYDSLPSVSTVSKEIEADYKLDTKPAQLNDDDDNHELDILKKPSQKHKIPAKNNKEISISVRESGKGQYHILLLHGYRSTSEIWEEIGTLQYLNEWGYRAFAADIPTHENDSLFVEKDKAVEWLTYLINTLHLKNLVIISPSLSGHITLPYIIQLNEQQELVRGFVPIDPVGTDRFNVSDYKKIKIPTLIVHGEKDTRFQSAFDNLKQIPTHKILLIKGTSYSSNDEKQTEFHNRLRQFLYNIYRPIYQNKFKSLNKKNSTSNKTKKFKIKSTRKLQQ